MRFPVGAWAALFAAGPALAAPDTPPAEVSAAGSVFQDCRDCPSMIVVGPGRFTMGSPPGEPEHEANEAPLHHVTIARPFAVGRFEVTVAEYRAFVRASGREPDATCTTHEGDGTSLREHRDFRNPGYAQTDRHPVVCVTWEDASAYADWLSRRTGRHYRLLSEAEWEYVARAGSTAAFPWGSQVSTAQAQYDGQTVYDQGAPGERRMMSLPVGSFAPNAFGVHDMAGNVWEWTLDCRHDNYVGAPTDGSAWLDDTMGECSSRIRRGGSWDGYAKSVRSANRYWNHLRFRSNYDGFRVAAEL